MLEKLKSFLANDTTFFAILVILVAVASFALGRLSNSEIVQYQSHNLAMIAGSTLETPEVTTGGEELVASKSGTKYHLLSCPGASQIKDSNKIFFADREAAEAAGFQPAANCPGLK